MAVKATVCHIINGNSLLLQKKSAGLFGEGKWNGVGGKLGKGETTREGAEREALEETGLIVSNLMLHGVLNFFFGEKTEPDWIVYVFSTCTFKGTLRPSSEGWLRWFTFDEIPYGEMWQDDEHWLPLLLEGKRFNGKFHFDEGGSELLHFDLEVES
jgi:8-oxo-dGTP pyrophosphatase MutT (NUDIX family)